MTMILQAAELADYFSISISSPKESAKPRKYRADFSSFLTAAFNKCRL